MWDVCGQSQLIVGTGIPHSGRVSSKVVRLYVQPICVLLWCGLWLGNPAFGTNPASTLFLDQHSLIHPFPHSLHPSSIPTLCWELEAQVQQDRLPPLSSSALGRGQSGPVHRMRHYYDYTYH